MSKYDDLVATLVNPTPRTVTPRETAHASACALQTSLFGRLRKTQGSAVAGRLGWMLVRPGQPEHVDCADALNAIAALPVADLRTLALAVRGARGTLKNAASAELAAEVLLILERGIEVGAAVRTAMAARPVTSLEGVGVGTEIGVGVVRAAVTAGEA